MTQGDDDFEKFDENEVERDEKGRFAGKTGGQEQVDMGDGQIAVSIAPHFPQASAYTAEGKAYITAENRYRRDKEKIKFNDAETKEVDISSVKANQSWVFPKIVDDYISGDRSSKKPPQMFHFRGSYYINDGTHRTLASKEQGRSKITARVIDLDPYDA